jgi:hypothetical protein
MVSYAMGCYPMGSYPMGYFDRRKGYPEGVFPTINLCNWELSNGYVYIDSYPTSSPYL